MAFPVLAGPGFAIAVRNSEPVALYILLHWAVQLDRVTKMSLWAMSVGQDFILEISDVLLKPHSQVPLLGCQDGIALARQHGLPALG